MVWDNPYGTIQPDRHKKSTFYEPGVNEQLKLLQPSESVSYTMSWDFYVHPRRKWEWGQKRKTSS